MQLLHCRHNSNIKKYVYIFLRIINQFEAVLIQLTAQFSYCNLKAVTPCVVKPIFKTFAFHLDTMLLIMEIRFFYSFSFLPFFFLEEYFFN